MLTESIRKRLEMLLAHADIRVGGDRPWDLKVSDERFFARCMAHGSLGFGESYMDGWWECAQIDRMFELMAGAGLEQKIRPIQDGLLFTGARMTDWFRRDRNPSSRPNCQLNPVLFRQMIGPTMIFSCASWNSADTLDSAQQEQLDFIGHRLGLKPGMRVLDMGCGYGHAISYLAKTYGISGVGVAKSDEEVTASLQACNGLDIQVQKANFGSIRENFDRVYSIEMLDRVPIKDLRKYMMMLKGFLKPGGKAFVQTIGTNRAGIRPDPWIRKYIFPDSNLPSASRIAQAMDGLLVVEDWCNPASDYERTFEAWHRNLMLQDGELTEWCDERSRRAWHYFLKSCIGGFRGRLNQLWKITLSAA